MSRFVAFAVAACSAVMVSASLHASCYSDYNKNGNFLATPTKMASPYHLDKEASTVKTLVHRPRSAADHSHKHFSWDAYPNDPTSIGPMSAWDDEGVSKDSQSRLSFSVLSKPAKQNVKYIAIFANGQESCNGYHQLTTGTDDGWKSKANQESFTSTNDWTQSWIRLDKRAPPQIFMDGYYQPHSYGQDLRVFPPDQSLVVAIEDTSFTETDIPELDTVATILTELNVKQVCNPYNPPADNVKIMKGWRRWLSHHVDWENIEGMYFFGMSRGGCFVTRFADFLYHGPAVAASSATWDPFHCSEGECSGAFIPDEDYPAGVDRSNIKLILETIDPVCGQYEIRHKPCKDKDKSKDCFEPTAVMPGGVKYSPFAGVAPALSGGLGGQNWHGPFAPTEAEYTNAEPWQANNVVVEQLFHNVPRKNIRWLKSMTGQDILPPWVQNMPETINAVLNNPSLTVAAAVNSAFAQHIINMFANYKFVNTFVSHHASGSHQNVLIRDDNVWMVHGPTTVPDPDHNNPMNPSLATSGGQWTNGNANWAMPGSNYAAPFYGAMLNLDNSVNSAGFTSYEQSLSNPLLEKRGDFGCSSWYKAFWVPWDHATVGGAHVHQNANFDTACDPSDATCVPCPGQSNCGYPQNPYGRNPAPAGWSSGDLQAWVVQMQQWAVNTAAWIDSGFTNPPTLITTCQPNQRADIDIVYKHVKHAAETAASWFEIKCDQVFVPYPAIPLVEQWEYIGEPTLVVKCPYEYQLGAQWLTNIVQVGEQCGLMVDVEGCHSRKVSGCGFPDPNVTTYGEKPSGKDDTYFFEPKPQTGGSIYFSTEASGDKADTKDGVNKPSVSFLSEVTSFINAVLEATKGGRPIAWTGDFVNAYVNPQNTP